MPKIDRGYVRSFFEGDDGLAEEFDRWFVQHEAAVAARALREAADAYEHSIDPAWPWSPPDAEQWLRDRADTIEVGNA